MKKHLSILIAAVIVLATAAPAHAALTTEGLKSYVKKVGARVDEAKGNLLVTSMPVGRGRVEIRLLNDSNRNRLGFYAYGLGNMAQAGDAQALYEYLLKSNSELAIGTFFVDEDRDIGYKAFLFTRDPISYQTFETVYLAMANVLGERGPRIMKMARGARDAAEPSRAAGESGPANSEPAAETPAPETPAPETPAAETPAAETPADTTADEETPALAEEPQPATEEEPPATSAPVFEPTPEAPPSESPQRPRRRNPPN